mgnify:CR=1 FL=1
MQIELSCVRVQTVSNETKSSTNGADSYGVGKSLPINVDQKNAETSLDVRDHRFECSGCGYIYDPSEGIKKIGVPIGTSFLDLDKDSFRCPVCRVGFDSYKDIGPKSKPSGFEENLTYGFGFNTLPSGQKNVLIFGGLAFAAACFLSLYSLK